MNIQKNSVASVEPKVSRRQFVTGIIQGALAAFLPALTLANTRNEQYLHINVAAIAKGLAANKLTSLRVLIPSGCEANLLPVISEFKSITGISIELVKSGIDEVNTKLLLDNMIGSDNYDLALPASFGLPDLVSAGAIVPITQYAKKYEPEGFRFGSLHSVSEYFDNETYGFESDGDAYIMFYLKQLLESADEQARYEDKFQRALAVPDTWAELDRQIEYFDRKDQNLAGGLLFRTPGYLTWEWWVRFHAKGYWPLSKNMEPQINSDAGVEALEEMRRVTEFLAPETKSLGLTGNWERYRQGNVFCNIGWGGAQKYLNRPSSAVRGKLLFGPTPGGYVDGHLLHTPYFNWGWNYVVTKSCPYPEVAYLFALFASSAEMSTVSIREARGFFDPFSAIHYQDPGIQKTYSNEFLAVHEESMLNAIPNLYLESQGQYFRSLNAGLDKVVLDKADARKTLNRVAAQWNTITNRSNVDEQTRRWMELRKKYPAKVRSLLKDLS